MICIDRIYSERVLQAPGLEFVQFSTCICLHMFKCIHLQDVVFIDELYQLKPSTCI